MGHKTIRYAEVLIRYRHCYARDCYPKLYISMNKLSEQDRYELVDDALNVAIKYIQDEIGVEFGDYAGIHFDDGKWGQLTAPLKDYLDAELKRQHE